LHSHKGKNLKKGKLLLVEDCPDEALACTRILEADNYQIDVVDDIKKSMSAISTKDYDIILLDLRLKTSNGIELLTWLNNQYATRMPTTIIITAFGDQEERLQALKLGATDVLRKPVDFGELKAKLALHIQIKQLQDKLSIRNTELTELTEAKEKLEQNIILKRQFLSLITHDLRTPITTIKLAAEVLREEILHHAEHNEVTPKVTDLLNVLLRNIIRVEGNFNEIMTIANLDVDGMTLSPSSIDINKLIADAIAICAPESSNNSIKIKTEFSDIPEIKADIRRIKQMLINIITISLSRMDVRDFALVKTLAQNNGILISVCDTGPYLNGKFITEVIGGLNKGLPTPQTRVSLYTASRIACAHGGKLDIKSDVDNGTSFNIWLPVNFTNTLT
jgi:signal transduction histidine kinase